MQKASEDKTALFGVGNEEKTLLIDCVTLVKNGGSGKYKILKLFHSSILDKTRKIIRTILTHF
jgi:hypothetical protein